MTRPWKPMVVWVLRSCWQLQSLTPPKRGSRACSCKKPGTEDMARRWEELFWKVSWQQHAEKERGDEMERRSETKSVAWWGARACVLCATCKHIEDMVLMVWGLSLVVARCSWRCRFVVAVGLSACAFVSLGPGCAAFSVRWQAACSISDSESWFFERRLWILVTMKPWCLNCAQTMALKTQKLKTN